MNYNSNTEQHNLALEKLEKVAPQEPGPPKDNPHGHAHGGEKPGWQSYWDLLLALLILVTLLVLEYGFSIHIPHVPLLVINLIAYLLAGRDVLKLAWRKSKRGDFFNEFVLMSVATIGAFIIGEYEEGVAVMVFYQIGEWFQDAAVDRAKRSIKSLLDVRSKSVTVLRGGEAILADPANVKIGEEIQIKPGEQVALDGDLVSENASFNTAALTGESMPDTKLKHERVLAGMINLNTPAVVKVTALYKDSKLSKILEMVQDATARKSKTQLFISRFAKVYTPIVFFLALALCVLPFFIVEDYVFRDWFYRALVFLVISCPCALVVSIPLGYFGGIGLASRNGILFKGGNYLDVMTQVQTVVMDKTGTLTQGVFKVQKVVPSGITADELLRTAVALEKHSTHPIAKAITGYAGSIPDKAEVFGVEEVPGNGMKGNVDGRQVIAGNLKFLKNSKITYPTALDQIAETLVAVAIDHQFAGYISIADEIKSDAQKTIKALHKMGISTVMLSGDKPAVVEQVAKLLNINEAYGNLLPDGKMEKVRKLKEEGRKLAFVGDGVNDAPVIALADVGIAMGGLGSDAAIETADVVIQNDQPFKILGAIKAGKITRNIVWQNIALAMGVKAIVLILGAGGVANLWEAVIADVGVALLAILNAVRIQRMKL